MLFLLLFLTQAQAFINIESLRSSIKDESVGNIKLLFNQQNGNTDKSTASFSTLNAKKIENREYLLLSGLNYGEAQGSKDTNDGSMHGRFTLYFKPTIGWESYIQFEYNDFTALNFREVYGQGLRFITHKSQTSAGAFGVGAFFEHEELRGQTNQDAVRGNIYVSETRKLTKTLKASLVAYYQPSLKRSNDERLIISAGSALDVTKSLTFNFEYSYRYDEQPPIGVEKIDAKTLLGLNLKY